VGARLSPLVVALAAAVTLFVTLPSAALAHARAPRATVAPSSSPGISVQGNRLYADGSPFVTRGVQIVGLVAPQAYLWGKYIAAGQHFGTAELQAAVANHANLVRFQVSEYGLDPSNPEYTPDYISSIQNAVEMARSLGLYVIISLQSESAAGQIAANNRCPLPDAGALTDWTQLASLFAGDTGIMFELYNEPGPSATAAGWSEWLNGGNLVYGKQIGDSCTAVGMQQLVDQIRAEGADNVIIVPALGGETNLAGIPTLNDPANPSDPQLAYGIHYPNLTIGVTAWDQAFGNFSAKAPVIVTEWDAAGITGGCTPNTPAQSVEMLTYLASKRIGIVGFALDLPGTIVQDYTYAPTTFADFACGVQGGPGQVLFDDYAAEARVQATAPLEGLDGAASWMVSENGAKGFLAAAPAAAQLLFNTPYSFVTGTGVADTTQLGVPNAVPTATFTNEARLAAAVNANQLPPGTVAVQYAPGSPVTPRNQLTDPANAFQQASLVTHAHGLLLIGAPSLNVVRATAPHLEVVKRTSRFLQRKIAAAAARYSDVYVIQAQTLEQTPSRFSAFVRQAAAQAVNAHGSVEILTEVRSGAGRSAPTTPMLEQDLSGAGSAVSGYVLSDSASTQPAPGDAALGLINSYAGQG